MSWDLITKFISRRMAALLVGLYFVDRITTATPDIKAYIMGGLAGVFIVGQVVEDCVLKIKPLDEPKNGG